MLKPAPMLVFLGSVAFPLLFLHPFLLKVSAEITMPFHEACLSLSPETRHASAYRAIVCGTNLHIGSLYQDLRATGLLHLIVISGSHLVFLEQTLLLLARRMKWLQYFIFPSLLLLTLAASAQPPVVRSLVSWILARASEKYRLGWTNLQRVTMSGLVSFTLCRDARDAQSLLLSWGAALALAFALSENSLRFSSQHESLKARAYRALFALRTQTAIYIALLPLLAPISVPHPGTILLNWLFGSALGLVLFPLSLFSFLFHPLHVVSDFAWDAASYLLSTLRSLHTESLGSFPVALPVRWVYLFSLTGWLLLNERMRRDRSPA